jgi:hypothetical protein
MSTRSQRCVWKANITWVLRQSNNLKTITKLDKYKMYGIDTSRDKLRVFDLVLLTS